MMSWLRALANSREGVQSVPAAQTGVMQSGRTADRYVVIDVETTGLSPTRSRIVELAMVTMDSSARIVDEYTTRLNPEGPVGATHIHGITEADVRTAPRFAQVLPEVVAVLRGAAIVAHNAPFDMKFLSAEFEREGWTLPSVPAVCTLQASHHYLPNLPRRTLADCCRASGVKHKHAHSALGDAKATAALLAHFLNPRIRPAVRAHDVEIIKSARGVTWPDGPTGPVRKSPPADGGRPHSRRSVPKPPSQALVSMVSRFSLLQAADAGASDFMVAYLEKLAEVLADGVLTGDEAADLADLASVYEFSAEDVAGANRAFLLALAHEALQDGKVAHAERAELKELAGLLAVDPKDTTTLLKRAETERHRRLSVGLPSLPQNWSHGDPLRVGDRIAFTGCDEGHRLRLEQASERAGVRVMNNVSGQTSILVADGSFDGTKAVAARKHGTRVVTPEVYEKLLQHLQPVH